MKFGVQSNMRAFVFSLLSSSWTCVSTTFGVKVAFNHVATLARIFLPVVPPKEAIRKHDSTSSRALFDFTSMETRSLPDTVGAILWSSSLSLLNTLKRYAQNPVSASSCSRTRLSEWSKQRIASNNVAPMLRVISSLQSWNCGAPVGLKISPRLVFNHCWHSQSPSLCSHPRTAQQYKQNLPDLDAPNLSPDRLRFHPP